ncbi:MAG: DUF167 domain-containing protein [Alphaproteobacteria bacterium]|nr:DUF167 domain-containing protein [Alphaproteobacteria bacterium]
MSATDVRAPSPLAPAADGVFLSVRVTPRARRRGIGAVDAEGALAVAVGAPPEDGKATAETVELLAAHFGLPKRAFALTQGAASRRKRFKIAGVPDALMETMKAKLP